MGVSYLDFWREHALDHIKPNRGGEFPEGWDVRPLLGRLVDHASVLEIGCGYGRLCQAFEARRYFGVDVCEAAIEAARERNPGYGFELADPVDTFFTGCALLYNVLMHVPDDALGAELGRLIAPRVIVVEILGRRWRRDGIPPVYNREYKEYVLAFAEAGYEPSLRLDVPCLCYDDTMLTFMEWTRSG